MSLTTPLFALIAPYFIWPLELIFPYPFVVEEIVKGLFVYLILKDGKTETKTKIILVFLTGIMFSLSESAMYLLNIFAVGSLTTLLIRLASTTMLHTTTLFMMYFTGVKKVYLIIPGFLLAILLHYYYNLLV